MNRTSTRESRLAQRERWRRLSPYHRALIMAERPDPLEEEIDYRHRTMTALENVYGARVWDATVAILAEGENDESRRYVKQNTADMDLEEIGAALSTEDGSRIGLSRERVRVIILVALTKLRRLPIVQEMYYGEPPRDREEVRTADLATIEAAIARATEAA